ncbi:MAG: Tungsten-containing formylmethanofuran dehydrogenase 2 subunit B [Promethearchaeota archaeon]|nr:MAG: Tungsten-containing formylmethanofuran dehydrogenase 2 subunit B [Candidatus Lokiarchaeota archaeon]
MVERDIITHTDVVCPFCGSLCDDLEVDVSDNKVVEVRNACQIGTQIYFSSNPDNPDRYKKPMMRKNGGLVEVSWEEALDRSAELLANAKRPLLYGWSSTEAEAISRGIELAEITGGILDNCSSICHGPSIMAIQDAGIPASTLGEYKNRADLVIFWGCNPVHAHPRHLGRYSNFIRGYFKKDGRNDRYMVVIDPRKTHTAQLADLHIQVNPSEDYELFSALRSILRGVEVEEESISGVPIQQIRDLVEKMKNCNYGVIFFGLGLTHSLAHHRNVENAICLTRELNDYTKFLIQPMRGHYNVAGSNIVFSWNTGYPLAIDFSRGYPRYNPGEYSTVPVLLRDEIDVSIIVATDPVLNLPGPAVENLLKHPVISVEPHETPTSALADIVLPVKISGVECEGTAYRMDNVPIRLRKVKDGPNGLLTDREIMKILIEKVKNLKNQ